MSKEILFLPIHKRWPGRYAFRVIMYTPEGSKLTVETDAEPVVASAIIKLLTLQASGSRPTPKLLGLAQAIVDEYNALKKDYDARKKEEEVEP